MISITDYINMKGKKFREKLASGYTMCECDPLRFNEGNLPDYRYYIVQDLYAMRYDLAYAHEYKRMYTRLLQRMSPGSELEVTSLGCGNMVDYWSLKRVLPANCRVSYHGVDAIDWDDKFAACKGDKIDFSLQYISDYLYDCDELESDVYVSPSPSARLTMPSWRLSAALSPKRALSRTRYTSCSLCVPTNIHWSAIWPRPIRFVLQSGMPA